MWKNIKVITVLTIAAIFAVFFLAVRSDYAPPSPPRWDMIAMFQSNREIQVTSFKLYNAVDSSINVSLTNFESLNYITKALRNPTADFDSGWTRRARITLSNRKVYDVKLVIAQGGQSLAVGLERGLFQDEKFYGVKLLDPVPNELTEALLKMTSTEQLQHDRSENKQATSPQLGGLPASANDQSQLPKK
jgi:hypothetical protein